MAPALLVRISFPGGVYRGSDLGRPEAIPSPARLHAAFLSAVSGGPGAVSDAGALLATEADRAAVAWLEDNPPLGIIKPLVEMTDYAAVRHRVRVAVDPKERRDLHRDETRFEPLSAVSGPVVYAWPEAPASIRERLVEAAREITHIGGADSTVVVGVSEGDFDSVAEGGLVMQEGRGPGSELRIAVAGRIDALLDAHRRACVPDTQHSPGAKNAQAKDVPPPSAGAAATRLVRFAEPRPVTNWPFTEAWIVPMSPPPPYWVTRPHQRVRSAVAVHRALVAAIGEDVPPFVSGRDGDGPLTGAGHLAIQFVRRSDHGAPALVLGLPGHVPAADIARLLDALDARPSVRFGQTRVRLGSPELTSALSFWHTPADLLATTVPLVLDAPGTPRNGSWSLDDAVLCSVGFALRGLLEQSGLEWGTGWTFRRQLVETLREYGVDARGFRVPGSASRFMHHSRAGDLLVTAHATVQLGELDYGGRALLALGRARHLGGGLLTPLVEQ